jgi:hypothetical protein
MSSSFTASSETPVVIWRPCHCKDGVVSLETTWREWAGWGVLGWERRSRFVGNDVVEVGVVVKSGGLRKTVVSLETTWQRVGGVVEVVGWKKRSRFVGNDMVEVVKGDGVERNSRFVETTWQREGGVVEVVKGDRLGGTVKSS